MNLGTKVCVASTTHLVRCNMLTQSHRPTDEQSEVLRLMKETSDNLLINSLAGTGKTTMLEMIEATIDEPILCLAFNKSVAQTMEKIFKPPTDVRTLNGLGHRIWNRSIPKKVTVDPQKATKILYNLLNDLPKGKRQSEAWNSYGEIIEATNLSKALGYVPPGIFPNATRLCQWDDVGARCDQEPTELVYNLTNKLLEACIKSSYEGLLDFNDQIYMPALFGGTYPRYPLVMVDEVQDLSPCNHQMLHKLVKGRLASVGDPFQSIYQFRGAEMDGMVRSAAHFDMCQTVLSISFRCPETIVRNVHWRVPAFKWIKEGGHVQTLDHIRVEDIEEGSAIICRNNAPLFKLAFHLLTEGRSVSVAGSDIGPRLIKTMQKLGDPYTTKSTVLLLIDGWLEDKLAKESKTAADMAAAMRVFAERGDNLGQAISYAESLFKTQGTIRLITGHKAKGL